jgi:hypothetical protein
VLCVLREAEALMPAAVDGIVIGREGAGGERGEGGERMTNQHAGCPRRECTQPNAEEIHTLFDNTGVRVIVCV